MKTITFAFAGFVLFSTGAYAAETMDADAVKKLIFEQKIERLIAVSPPPSKKRLEVLRSYGSEEDKAHFLNQDKFVYPQKLEDIYQKSKGETLLPQRSHCPRYCRVVPCKPPYLTDCGVICGPDDSCPDPQCKPGQAC